MKSTRKSLIAISASWALALLLGATVVLAQQAAAAANRFLGAIVSINGDTLTVKTAQGDSRLVQVPATATLKRVEPGQTNLSAAVDMQFADLAVGDRVLVNLDPNSTGATPQALRVVAIKAADVQKRQQQEAEEWQRGVGGLVKSVDAAAGVIVIATGAGPTARDVTVKTTSATVLKRYAVGSVRFDEAVTAPIAAIQVGDQLRAKGQRNADEIDANEVVSGSFRNISGTVTSIDAASSTLVVKDLASKKQVTIHMGAETQMRRLPDRMAQFIAMRLKGQTPAGYGGGANGGGAGAAYRPPTSPAGGNGNGGPPRAGSADMQQALSRAPAIQLSELQKGEAVMLVSTQGTSDVTAITVLAGVEPLLEAPASQDLLSNWSMGTSAPEEAVQ